jgi:excisionase family DNA binding protein
MNDEDMTQTAPRIALSVDEAAASIGISVGSMYDQIRRGQIPSKKMGRKILVPVNFMDYLPGSRAEPPSDTYRG